jgi:HAD superfamily hydrolase (TIGR01509 family)
MITRRVSAVLFDASGTLIDDVFAVWKANAETLRWLGSVKPLPFNLFREKTRMPYWKFYGYFGVPEEKAKRAAVPKFKQVYDSLSETILLIPNAKTVLEQLKARALKIAVVTHSPHQMIEAALRNLGVLQFVDVIVGLEDCDEQKPSPKPVLTALAKLGVPPSEAIYVGDMCEDVLAGRSAGVTTVAYCGRGSYTPEKRLRQVKPDRVIHDLSELAAFLEK